MKSEKISLTIDSICKKYGICYESINPHFRSFLDDAIKLGCMYQDLKTMIGDIMDIEDRHGLNGIKVKMDEVIKELDRADHEIIKLARQLMDKDENKAK